MDAFARAVSVKYGSTKSERRSNMKKLIAILIAIVMLVALTGCGVSVPKYAYIRLPNGIIREIEIDIYIFGHSYIQITSKDGVKYITGTDNIWLTTELLP